MANLTYKSHDYHAGAVFSTIFVRNNLLILKTQGFGYRSSPYMKFENEVVGRWYFGYWQSRVQRQMQDLTGQSVR